jgi:hypothetical protein
MAQTGFTPISLYYTTTASAAPTAGNLVAGELAINTADGKLFYKDSAGVVQVIGTKGGVGSSTTTQVLYNSSGLVVGSANMTFNGTSLTLANPLTIQNATLGYGGGSVNTNFGVGYGTLLNNTSGSANAAFGYGSLQANTTGASNVAIGGYNALTANTTGSSNIAIGQQALQSNTTASNNTAVGYQAGYSNTTGTNLANFGYLAGYTNTTGGENTAIGVRALYSNSTGGSNTAVGRQALEANTADSNTGIGTRALWSNTTGASNTAVGQQALNTNTTASNNTAVGYQAGLNNTTGASSVFVGQAAGLNTTSSFNTFIGREAGYNVTSGAYNTFLGQASGYYITTGAKNTVIGQYNGNQGGVDIRTLSNIIVLSDGDGNPVFVNGMAPVGTAGGGLANTGGYTTLGLGGTGSSSYTGSLGLRSSSGANRGPVVAGYANDVGVWSVGSQAVILQGGSTSQFLMCQNTGGGVYLNGASATSWSAVSDSRLKENLTPINNALTKVASLSAVVGNYTWDESKTKKPFLIAQEVQAVLPEAVTYSQAIKDDSTEYLSLSYTEVIPLLVAAIKELKTEVDSLKQQLGK